MAGRAFYKRAIQLHGIDRQAFQVTERRIASAKVIDCHPRSQVSDFCQQIRGRFRVFHDRSLSQLQFQTNRIESSLPQGLHH